VGAYTADTGGSIYAIKKYNVGKSYVVFGKKDTYSIELSDISSIPAAMSDNSMALVLSFLPNTTYDLPAFDLLLESGPQICGVPVGKSYVVFGKKDTYSIELSDISSGIGGFVIIGELADDKSGWSVSSAGDVRIYLRIIWHHKHPQSNHLSRHR
jgi:hypothetical protein